MSWGISENAGEKENNDYFRGLIEALNQKSKIGHWTPLKDEYGDVIEAVCSNCHKNGNHKWNLCPHCSAIMVESQESEEA